MNVNIVPILLCMIFLSSMSAVSAVDDSQYTVTELDLPDITESDLPDITESDLPDITESTSLDGQNDNNITYDPSAADSSELIKKTLERLKKIGAYKQNILKI